MPTYDYVCEACGHRFEHFQSMTSRRKRKCPDCGKPKLVRLVGSGAGLIFKGSGFYETDYKRAGEKAPSESTSEKSESKSESKSKSKSESKGESKSGSTSDSSSGSGGDD